ncbi:hypothetical protein BH09PLA1_BH09PLA1_01370 [soil metagenome]
MDEKKANLIADALRGETWQSGGDIWLAVIRRADGGVVVISDDAVCEYENEAKFEESNPARTILVR